MTYSYTYNRGPKLTEAEIYQQAVAKAELEAARKAIISFYRDEQTGEILTFCQECFNAVPVTLKDDLTYIDKAGDWDICGECDAQNIPADYHGEPQ